MGCAAFLIAPLHLNMKRAPARVAPGLSLFVTMPEGQ